MAKPRIVDFFRFPKLETFSKYVDNALKEYKPPIYPIDDDVLIGIEVEVEGILTNKLLVELPAPKEMSEKVPQVVLKENGDTTIENVEVPAKSKFLWNNVEDGSLRNHGREFVSIPVKGAAIPFALEKLKKELSIRKDCVGHEFTDRTSVHVHVDVRDLELEHVMNFIISYLAMEPLLYNFVEGNRFNNIFCVPISQTNLHYELRETFRYFHNQQELDCVRSLNNWRKYTGFNLKPIREKGTIEFRHMPGTLEHRKLMLWINMILRLRKFSTEQTYLNLKEKILQLNTTSEYLSLVRDVFGWELSENLNINNIQSQMEDMIIFIKDCYTENSNEKIYKMGNTHVKGKTIDEVISMPFVSACLKNKIISLKGLSKSSKAKTAIPIPNPQIHNAEIDDLRNIQDNWIPQVRIQRPQNQGEDLIPEEDNLGFIEVMNINNLEQLDF